jgi:selenide,water dikinase
VISTAIKKGVAEQSWIDAAVASMTALNKKAAEIITDHVGTGASPVRAERSSAARRFGVHAMTDITGFGLIGHAREVALGSNVVLHLYASRLPLLEGALECVRAGHIPGGLKANREFAECVVVSEEVKTLLFDPQTAGGLLISVASDDAIDLTRALNAAGVPAVEIGDVHPDHEPLIAVSK